MTGKILVLTVAVISLFLPDSLRADDLSSRWLVDQYTKSRLFVGDYDDRTRTLHLGWQITLKDGWKTYWRAPGGAGLPPRWTWKDARNIRSITVNWPLPEKQHIFDVDTYIYHDQVILPIDVVVKDADKPVSLSLDLQYLICSDICIPRKGDYHLSLPALKNMPASAYQAALLARYRALVPTKISDQQIRVTQDRKNILQIELPDSLDSVDTVIVETADGLLPGKPGAEGQGRFRLPAGKSLTGQILTLTLILKNGAAKETKVPVKPKKKD